MNSQGGPVFRRRVVRADEVIKMAPAKLIVIVMVAAFDGGLRCASSVRPVHWSMDD